MKNQEDRIESVFESSMKPNKGIPASIERQQKLRISSLIADEKIINSKINTDPELYSKRHSDLECPQVYINLKSILKENTKKVFDHVEIFNSLRIKDTEKETRINDIRLKQRANDINNVRSAPLINQKSKQIIEEKKRKEIAEEVLDSGDDDYHESLREYFPEGNSSISRASLPKPIKRQKARINEALTADILKSSMKLRENMQVSNQHEMSIQKLNSPKRLKAMPTINVQNKEKKRKKKIKNQQSAVSFTYRVPPPSSKLRTKNDSVNIRSNPIVSNKYAQFSPFIQSIRYQDGFNYEELKSRGHEIVDYKLLTTN